MVLSLTWVTNLSFFPGNSISRCSCVPDDISTNGNNDTSMNCFGVSRSSGNLRYYRLSFDTVVQGVDPSVHSSAELFRSFDDNNVESSPKLGKGTHSRSRDCCSMLTEGVSGSDDHDPNLSFPAESAGNRGGGPQICQTDN